MSKKYWGWSIACAALGPWLLGAGGAPPLTIGVVLPQGNSAQSAALAEPLRQSLIGQFKAQSVEAVPLTATSDSLIDGEAQTKHISYVLYTHLQPGSVSGGLRSRLSLLTGILPMPKAVGSTLGTENPSAPAATLAAATLTSIKHGDTIQLGYRFVAVGSASPIKSDSLGSGKAGSDGQDIVSPLVPQLVNAVTSSAQDNPSATAPASSGRSSVFGGLFGHRTASNPIPPGGSAGSSVDCAKIASMPNAIISAEACQKLNGAQQTYTKAASDPSATRPGDEQMTCTQITAELKQQQFTAPDKTRVAEAQATTAQEQQLAHKEEINALKMQAKDQAAVNAASAADTATELATGGLVRGRALQATEKVLEEEHRANNERVIKETAPVVQKMNGQTADFGADFASQLQSNPRLARLMQLADNKHCKGGR